MEKSLVKFTTALVLVLLGVAIRTERRADISFETLLPPFGRSSGAEAAYGRQGSSDRGRMNMP